MKRTLSRIANVFSNALRSPIESMKSVERIDAKLLSEAFLSGWPVLDGSSEKVSESQENPLRRYFDSVTSGPGVWKWLHYFEAYHRHFSKFIGRRPIVVEIGVYSGGSLLMWHDYFGPGTVVHGIDIQEECRAYATDATNIHIGDQADRAFWASFKKNVPHVDIVIDDGGHLPIQQITTFEELIHHVSPGGIFVCEDVQGRGHEFTAKMAGIVDRLNDYQSTSCGDGLSCAPNAVQRSISSVHHYPFITVLEKATIEPGRFSAPKHGSQWAPKCI